MAIKRKKFLLPIPDDVDRALRHAAIARGRTVSETVVDAITEMVGREGWLASKDAGADR